MTEMIGPSLRRLRVERGLSQARVAEQFAQIDARLAAEGGDVRERVPTRHDVSRWEREGRIPDTPTLRVFAELFETPLSVLEVAAGLSRRLRSQHTGTGSPTRIELCSGTWGVQNAAELADLFSNERESINDDTALQVAHQWLLAEPPQLAELRAGRRVGADLVEHAERRLGDLRRMDDFMTGPDLAQMVTKELRATVGLLKEGAYQEHLGRRLLSVTGDLAQLAGWIASDLGWHQEAERHYLSGVSAAHAAGNLELAANLLSSLSYQKASLGASREAVVLAMTALQGSASSGLVRALLLERLAWAHARAGEQAETERALGRAGEAFADRSVDNEPDWVYWLDQNEIDVMAGRCYTELGRPLRAQPLLTSAIDLYDRTHVRESALYLSWLAESYVQAGEIDQAAQTASRMLDLSADLESARVSRRLGDLERKMQQVDSTEARVFLDHYRTVRSARATRSVDLAATLGQNAPGAGTEEDDVERRTFLALSTAPVLAQLDAIKQRMGADLVQALPAADVDRSFQQVGRYVAQYGGTAPIGLLENLAADLAIYADLCARHPHHRDMHLVTARLCGLVGALHTDLEQASQAREWLQTSARYASVSGSPEQRWWAAMALAMLAIYRNEPREVIRLAQRSREQIGEAACPSAAQLTGLSARAHTALGNSSRARSELQHAEQLFDQLETTTANEPFFGFPAREMAMYRSQVLTGVGDSAAWNAQAEALNSYPDDDPMDRPLILLDRARLLLKDGDAREAAKVGGDAIGTLRPALRVPLLMTQARMVGREIATVSRRAASDFRQRIAA